MSRGSDTASARPAHELRTACLHLAPRFAPAPEFKNLTAAGI